MKYIYILVIAVLTGSLSSCNDWLDVSPKQYIPADKMFESESGFQGYSHRHLSPNGHHQPLRWRPHLCLS